MDPNKLLDLFRNFNAKYFESQLQIPSVEYKEDFEDYHMGRYDPQSNQILIRGGLCDSQERITLLHEMIHKRLESDYHGEDFRDELARCAKNSCPSFRKEILSELEITKDLARFDYMNKYAWVEKELFLLQTEKPCRPWEEIKQCFFEASHLTEPEFIEMEAWISQLWDYFCGRISHRPPAPPIK